MEITQWRWGLFAGAFQLDFCPPCHWETLRVAQRRWAFPNNLFIFGQFFRVTASVLEFKVVINIRKLCDILSVWQMCRDMWQKILFALLGTWSVVEWYGLIPKLPVRTLRLQSIGWDWPSTKSSALWWIKSVESNWFQRKNQCFYSWPVLYFD